MTDSWNLIARDIKIVLDQVYFPLSIDVEAMEEFRTIDYYPPFYMSDKCNEQLFGVHILCGKGHSDYETECELCHIDLSYPLICKSEIYSGTFAVLSASDWINHADKYITWKDKIQKLIKEILQ
jgi:hypothetical protein